MDITQKPTYQEICDLIQAITGGPGSVVSTDLDVDFVNKMTATDVSTLNTRTQTALQIYHDIADIYFWSHMLDCSGCCSIQSNYNDFWGQYYQYAKKGYTSKTIDSVWPSGSEEHAQSMFNHRQKYQKHFPRLCELCASGVRYDEALEIVCEESTT